MNWVFSSMVLLVVTSSVAAAQVGNNTSPSTSNPSQPGLSSGQAGSSNAAGTSQLGTQSGGAASGTNTAGGSGPVIGQAVGEMMSASSIGDATLSAMLIVDNEGEVALSELGAQQATHPDVKTFAEQMVKDHSEMLSKLRNVSDSATKVNQGQEVSKQSNVLRPAAGTDNSPSTTSAGNGQVAAPTQSPNLTAADLKRELGKKCLESKQLELQRKKGSEFDKCFMEMQVAMHQEAVDTLQVFQRHAQGDLRRVIEEALPKVTEHLKHAKMTKQMVEDGGNHTKSTP